ncbi:hypothetical protein, variant [Aphanomyces invadans]|uniref:Uncharacterized protein n=1 Tax=Aphanomyces invadans TaxID=157072 RepID=A0A024UCH1_9STRA|nr:hypothetical protein H310_04354 [Aphanomyces invadans]XP_008866895.1 hypothetical protein, variant [Aphanomyces invadans]ETW03938.1 hypothetical protein H310_04354 [Aphanomyces invadans]ETW03939.1 hypothetical protein, variant [Aphanomyces invadans]|eukprot:XP_008866894.1 hypothetical protein H310_04354 [Aphanomyces invadans]
MRWLVERRTFSRYASMRRLYYKLHAWQNTLRRDLTCPHLVSGHRECMHALWTWADAGLQLLACQGDPASLNDVMRDGRDADTATAASSMQSSLRGFHGHNRYYLLCHSS